MFARRRSRLQQAIVEIDDASSGFLQFVVMAFRGDQRSQLVHRHRDPLLAYAAPNADPVHGRLHLPSVRRLLSQHLPTWDEWSSPGELIHPGDWPSISSDTSNQTKPVYGWGIRNGIRVVGRELAPCLSRRRRGANREAISRPSGCRTALRAPAPHQPLWLPGACGGKCRGTRRFALMIVSQCFWAESVGVLRDAVVVYLAVDGGP